MLEAQKKKAVSLNLKKKMLGVKIKGYDLNIGFVCNFEWIAAMSKNYTYCQVVYGVHAGKEILAAPSLMSFHKCEMDRKGFKKCIFDEKYYIYDVVPVTPALLMFQIEAHYSPTMNQNERVEILGWTMVDLFDEEGELKYIFPFFTLLTIM